MDLGSGAAVSRGVFSEKSWSLAARIGGEMTFLIDPGESALHKLESA
jgi:hypothetical protein